MASVLIIDDYAGTVATYCTVTRLAGFEATAASTGEEGIMKGTARTFDAVLVDLQLPDMSGIDVVKALRPVSPLSRLVVVTAFPTFGTSFDAGCVGADGYVDGALFGEEVIDVVRQALHGPYPVRHPSRRDASGGGAREAATRVLDPRIRESLRQIDSNPPRVPSVRQLAEAFRLSESRFRHLFTDSVGVSPTAYASERRLHDVANRLRNTSDPVNQAAYAAGYGSESLSDFRREFRRRFGMSPTEYRSRYNSGHG